MTCFTLSEKPYYLILQLIKLCLLFPKQSKVFFIFYSQNLKKTIKWFKENKMTVNADKFQVLLIDKTKQDHTKEVVQIEEQSIKAVELLGIEIDDKLRFNLHISKICNSVANQLNAVTHLRNSMTFNIKEALINSYFMSNFNYCPVVQMFSSVKSLNRIQYFQKRALRILLDD